MHIAVLSLLLEVWNTMSTNVQFWAKRELDQRDCKSKCAYGLNISLCCCLLWWTQSVSELSCDWYLITNSVLLFKDSNLICACPFPLVSVASPGVWPAGMEPVAVSPGCGWLLQLGTHGLLTQGWKWGAARQRRCCSDTVSDALLTAPGGRVTCQWSWGVSALCSEWFTSLFKKVFRGFISIWPHSLSLLYL